MSQSPAQRRGDPAYTGKRLAVALFSYFALVTLVITLSPFDFAPMPFRIGYAVVLHDVLLNIALFLPLGFLLRSLQHGRPGRGRRVVVLLGAASVAVEIGQLFLHGRFSSPVDVFANTAGAYLGVVLRDRIERWPVWSPQVVGRTGLDIPLVGLLYLLVPQLWLSILGVVEDPRSAVTTVLLAGAGALVLNALMRHRNGSSRGDRRFESDTLRRFFPIFAVYMVVAALWSPFRAIVPWHGAIGFLDRLNDAGAMAVMELLEQVGAFTLFGYAIAEWRGRREMSLVDDVPFVAATALVFAVALEGAQGLLAGPGASLTRGLMSTVGATYGVAVYHLARQHVRALRAIAPAVPNEGLFRQAS
jgi:VanZ family protein